jgi:hypothetical protein
VEKEGSESCPLFLALAYFDPAIWLSPLSGFNAVSFALFSWWKNPRFLRLRTVYTLDAFQY